MNIFGIFFAVMNVVMIVSSVIMIRQLLNSAGEKTKLKKQLSQQEMLISLSQRLSVSTDYEKLIYDALEISGKLIMVRHAFLAPYREENCSLECRHEWFDGINNPAVGIKDQWLLTKEMDSYSEITGNGYVAINNDNRLTHPEFTAAKEYRPGPSLTIAININGKFWGILGFIIYETPRIWQESEINLGRKIAEIFTGIINRTEAQEELVKAKETAERRSKLKGDFLSRMSHEIRTPMNAIIGMTKIGLKAQETERKDYCLEKIESASNHLLGVINDILDISKIEADKFELFYTDFRLDSMLEKIFNIISFQMEGKKQNYILTVEPDVPAVIKSDEQRLCQIITNLIGNAIKFTPEKGAISLLISLINRENGIATIQFEVKDNGIGIPAEKLEKLFDPFEQAHGSISGKAGGTGLGLAISKRIVEMMGGAIRVESVPGTMTSFIFTINAEISESAGEAVCGNEAAFSDSNIQNCFKDKKVLISEDIEINREILAELLSFTGIVIDFAVNGRMAYEMFNSSPFAYGLIFMDLQMPELNGYEATAMIRLIDNPRAKKIPIIAMTASAFNEDITRCYAIGMNDHIAKPVKIEEIIDKIKRYYL